MTPNPQSTITSTPAIRNRRWQSDLETVNQDSDFDSRSVDRGIFSCLFFKRTLIGKKTASCKKI